MSREDIRRVSERCLPETGPMQALNCQVAKALIVNEGARLCASAAGPSARAVVLSGSMSRGEATLKRNGAGWHALGDATFVVLFDGPARLDVTKLQRDIEDTVLTKDITCKIAVLVATTDELCRMKPHIYAYELRERGIVLRGDKDALHLIPPFTAAEIPQEDGWWFLCNRIIEQIESVAESSGLDEADAKVRYRIAKLYLAMAACYLLTIGQYLPSYRERAARLEALAEDENPPAAPISIRHFAKLVSQCTSLKLQGEIAAHDTADFPQWDDAVADAEALWRWALARITGLSWDRSRNDLLTAIAARQPILGRAKAWARAAYVCGSGERRNWLRWSRMALSMSPRYWVYRAASELFFVAKPDAIPPDQIATIVAQLPLPSSKVAEISWRDATKLVLRNFHLFVESTRC